MDNDGDGDASARALRRTLAAASPTRLAKTVSAAAVDVLGTTFARFSRGAGPAGHVVVVSGLAVSATSAHVATLLEPHGAVEACALVAGGGAACVRFAAAEAANRAVVAGATEASGTRVAITHLVAALPPRPSNAAARRHRRHRRRRLHQHRRRHHHHPPPSPPPSPPPPPPPARPLQSQPRANTSKTYFFRCFAQHCIGQEKTLLSLIRLRRVSLDNELVAMLASFAHCPLALFASVFPFMSRICFSKSKSQ